MSSAPSFANYSMKTETKHDEPWYEWCVFIDAARHELDEIDRIEYTLHPTFEDPQRTSSDAGDCFAVYSSGWGSFSIGIEVFFKSGERALSRHWLTLSPNNWPTRTPTSEQLAQNERRVYDALTGARSRWRKRSTLARRAGMSTEEVQAVLRSMEARNFARKAFFPSVDGEEMWGSTSVVGVAPRPRQR